MPVLVFMAARVCVAPRFRQLILDVCLCFVFLGGNQDGKFSVGFRDGVVQTVVGLDRETQAAYNLVVEAIGASGTQMEILNKFNSPPMSVSKHNVFLYLS